MIFQDFGETEILDKMVLLHCKSRWEVILLINKLIARVKYDKVIDEFVIDNGIEEGGDDDPDDEWVGAEDLVLEYVGSW